MKIGLYLELSFKNILPKVNIALGNFIVFVKIFCLNLRKKYINIMIKNSLCSCRQRP
ncbi:hypothetical protein GCM10008904_30210 [Paraclostridium ghonii]